jgi:LuxR family glucitol operon transcriptional activator
MLESFLLGKLGDIVNAIAGNALKQPLKKMLEEQALQSEVKAAVRRAEAQFKKEYRNIDPELTQALSSQTRLTDSATVQTALKEMLTNPFHDPSQQIATVQKSFSDVLPGQPDRVRVDAAVSAFLKILGEEVLRVKPLQEVYNLYFQKVNAESSRRMAEQTAALGEAMHQLQTDLRQSPSALPAPAELPSQRRRPWHNLPQRAFTQFVGRETEMSKLTQLMLPYPRSRHFIVVIDGIGGVGKSALALELAHRYHENLDTMPAEERFEAIVWVSAKRTLLTASGIKQRQQTFNTLDDLFREIATVLELPAIMQAEPEQRRGLVERALTGQRTLLIVDNLETVDDEELLTFLRDLPDPTKVIITTRHRIDIAYAIRLTGMSHQDALELIVLEAERKNVGLEVDKIDDLFRRTGGIPLAIEWSIGLMSLGHSVESVLRRLGSGHSDIARFCFAESVERIRKRDAYRLLLTLALFESSVNRQMLGEVAGLGDDEIGRDDGLAELLQLSLINQKSDRFKLLPLTHSYALDELEKQPDLERELRENWIEALTKIAEPYNVLEWRQPDRYPLRDEGKHLVTLANWCEQVERLEILLQILPALTAYYDLLGQWANIIIIGQKGLEYARLVGDSESAMDIQSHVLGWLLAQQGRFDEAEQYIKDAFKLAQEKDDKLWQSAILLNYSQLQRRRGLIAKAEAIWQQAFQLSTLVAAPEQTYLQADLENEMGKIKRDQGDWQAAEKHFLAAREVFSYKETNPTFNIERAWGIRGNLGYIAHQLGKLEDAARRYKQCLQFFKEIGSRGYMTTLLVRLAFLEEQRGNKAEALAYAREALDWSGRLDMVKEQAEAEALCQRLNDRSS